ncbi:hypothetical protein N7366_25470 [Aeromonas caviae]|uniref:Uncharacterized protein n=1 Tax=Aeromonas caviae TaxID=648 RepID=A0AA42RAU4_AERCA|nr:hypothetical protein [Aeromonas caviae]MDH0436506.1 hypothetical protein [Aeromonas caviae]MDH0477453.1 hypothetical protein [Aeromonas caviae]MDH0939166.1 hypothetical protein [Aeromonas caviae]MDH1399982.1 hypothetical protein [Aeromonas caviae]MDH1505895.1 hypothetical protein [Aeromonas caviae]
MERAQAEARMEEILGWLNAMRQGWVQHDSKQAAALQKEDGYDSLLKMAGIP